MRGEQRAGGVLASAHYRRDELAQRPVVGHKQSLAPASHQWRE
jgi:hypothetical protein